MSPAQRKQAERDRKRALGQKLCQYWLTDAEKIHLDKFVHKLIKKRKVEP